MTASRLTSKSFNTSNRRLCELAQVLVLDVIRHVQACTHTLLKSKKLSAELLRWVKSDLTETVLAKDVEQLSAESEYIAQPTVELKTMMLEQALTGTLIAWLITKADREDTELLLQATRTLYGLQGTDSWQ